MLPIRKAEPEFSVRIAPRIARPSMRVVKQNDFGAYLASLVAEANAAHCAIDRLLIAKGHAAETAFYRRLADYLGLPFFPFPISIDRAINPHEALATGLAPVDARTKPDDVPTFLYAPQGPRLAWIAEHLHATLHDPDAQIAITTPTRFRSSIRATFGDDIAHAASGRLYKIAQSFSALAISKFVWLALMASGLALIAFSMMWSVKIWTAALLIVTCFPVLPGLTIKFMALQNTRYGDVDASLLNDSDLPTYTVLVPIYREAAILPQLISSLSSLDYPKPKLDIKLLIEADDVETLAAFETLALPSYFDVIICPRGVPRTKPRALTIGLAYTTSDYVVVYDAEDIPEPDQLRKAASIFKNSDKRLVCLQARLTIDNLDDSWLTQQFALEYAALFDVLLPGLACLNQPIPLGGTSNHFRREALQRVGGWDPWNVTEDADLGMRLYRAGYRVKTFNSTTHEEAPANLKAWTCQRTRWLKGWMQTAIVHLRSHGRRQDHMGVLRWVMLILAASLPPISALFHPSLLFFLNFIIDLQSNTSPSFGNTLFNGCFLAMFCASSLFDMMLIARGAAERRIPLTLGGLLGIIPYSHLKTWAAWRGLIELLHAPFHWSKTEHGLARTSRRHKFATD